MGSARPRSRRANSANDGEGVHEGNRALERLSVHLEGPTTIGFDESAVEQIVGRERVSQVALMNSKLSLARDCVNFYEAGSGQEVIRIRLVHPSIRGHTNKPRYLVGCFRGLSQRCDEAHSQTTRFALKLTRKLFVISIRSRTFS